MNLSHRARKRIREAKKKARPGKVTSLSYLLTYYNFLSIVTLYTHFLFLELSTSESWVEQGYAKNFDLSEDIVKDTVERIHVKDVSCEEFIEKWEKPYKPVVILGVQDSWAANYKWTQERLSKKYRNQKFKCGEDNEGYSVKMKMKYYMDYMQTTDDDSPLYIFDSSFGDV